MVLDRDTPALNKLTVLGVLEIPDTLNASSTLGYRSVVIDAVYVSIQVSTAVRSSSGPVCLHRKSGSSPVLLNLFQIFSFLSSEKSWKVLNIIVFCFREVD